MRIGVESGNEIEGEGRIIKTVKAIGRDSSTRLGEIKLGSPRVAFNCDRSLRQGFNGESWRNWRKPRKAGEYEKGRGCLCQFAKTWLLMRYFRKSTVKETLNFKTSAGIYVRKRRRETPHQTDGAEKANDLKGG